MRFNSIVFIVPETVEPELEIWAYQNLYADFWIRIFEHFTNNSNKIHIILMKFHSGNIVIINTW